MKGSSMLPWVSVILQGNFHPLLALADILALECNAAHLAGAAQVDKLRRSRAIGSEERSHQSQAP